MPFSDVLTLLFKGEDGLIVAEYRSTQATLYNKNLMSLKRSHLSNAMHYYSSEYRITEF